MADFVIRRATPADNDELVRLRRLMFAAMDLPLDDRTWEASFVAHTDAGTKAGTVAAFVADVDGRVVGSGIGAIYDWPAGPANPYGRTGYIYSMATDPDWRGRGVARSVVAALLDWFVGEGIERVSLHATAEGEPIYRSFGFQSPRFPELSWRAAAATP